jgi:hypothetical protein
VEVGEYMDSFCEDLDDEEDDDEVKWRERERERERGAQEISWEGWDSLFLTV